MGLRKGMTNNPNGRPEGSRNKVGADLRVRITDFLEGKFGEILEAWEDLEPKDKILFFEKLLVYALPKLQTISEESTKPIVINWHEDRTYEDDEDYEPVDYSKLTDEQLYAILEASRERRRLRKSELPNG